MAELMNKKQVLIIDDEEGILELLRGELLSQGHQVSSASNGLEALEKIKEKKFDLIISDIKMPKMDGIRLLGEIKKTDPNVEVILTTAFGTIETAVHAMKKGAYDFIQKPFNLNEVRNLVEKALEKSELRALVALYQSSKVIFSTVEIDELLSILVNLSFKLFKVDDVSIMLLENNEKLAIASSKGLKNENEKKIRISVGELLLKNVRNFNQGITAIQTPKNDPDFSDIKGIEQIQSLMVAPLSSVESIFGVVCFARTKEDTPFVPDDQRHAQILLSQMAQSIHIAKLYKKLGEKVEALEKAYSELSRMKDEIIQTEKLAAIGQLASGVAHELNNPLTTIIGLSDLLVEDGDRDSEKVKDYVTIKEQADRCRKIILNLLQFARKEKHEIKEISVNEVVEKTLELLEYELKSSGVEVVKEFDRSNPMIKGDFHRIEQVILNMINNARDALAKREHPRLLIQTVRENDQIKIIFSDNGSGIPEKVMSKIFDPFFTTKEVGKGTGLGLSISFGIVKDHGGTIHVKSKEDYGTTFSIVLPVVG